MTRTVVTTRKITSSRMTNMTCTSRWVDATKRLEEKFNLVLVISSADLVQTDQRLFLTSQDLLQWASLICLSVLKVHLDLCDDSRLPGTHWEHYRGHRVSEVTLIYDTVSVPDIISLSQ